MEMVELSLIEEASYRKELHELIRQHYLYTGSKLARTMLDDWNKYVDQFIQVVQLNTKSSARRANAEIAAKLPICREIIKTNHHKRLLKVTLWEIRKHFLKYIDKRQVIDLYMNVLPTLGKLDKPSIRMIADFRRLAAWTVAFLSVIGLVL